jgi:hypothetical protein
LTLTAQIYRGNGFAGSIPAAPFTATYAAAYFILWSEYMRKVEFTYSGDFLSLFHAVQGYVANLKKAIAKRNGEKRR